MAIASFLTTQDILDKNLRVSTAGPAEVLYYNAAAYKRMGQIYGGDQDGRLITTMFPKATIELLLLLEEAWWPTYITKAPSTTLFGVAPGGQLITGFKPELLVKKNQWLIEVETFLVISNFYGTLINDNANINKKDEFNYKQARDRYDDKWTDIQQAMHFYDVNSDGLISKIEENLNIDLNYYSQDTRFF